MFINIYFVVNIFAIVQQMIYVYANVFYTIQLFISTFGIGSLMSLIDETAILAKRMEKFHTGPNRVNAMDEPWYFLRFLS